VYLEYDRYQDDKYGRVLAWVWVGCEGTPRFLPPDYMHKSNNASNPGLMNNPPGCAHGMLVNEEMVRGGYARVVVYEDRGELKYQQRLSR
jgi:endonuclease YncB( thermonuclease family)